MKKLLCIIMTTMVFMGLFLLPASAESATLKDTLEEGLPLVFEKSKNIRYQKNENLGITVVGKYGQGSSTSAIGETAYLIYKVNGSITGFSIDAKHCTGLGTPADISVSLSKNNKDWVDAETKATDMVFDPDVYIDYDHAYWVMSTVSNKSKCPEGYAYIRITLNPYTKKGSVNWNTQLDTIIVSYDGKHDNTAPPTSAHTTKGTDKVTTITTKSPKTTITPAPTTTHTNPSNTTENESTTELSFTSLANTDHSATANGASTQATDAMAKPEKRGTLVWVWILVGAVVLSGAGVGVYFLIKSKKSKEV